METLCTGFATCFYIYNQFKIKSEKYCVYSNRIENAFEEVILF